MVKNMIVFLLLLLGAVMNDTSARDVISDQ